MKQFLFLVCLMSFTSLSAQKFDNVWCMGYESNGDSTTMFGGQNIDFRYDPPKVFYRNREAYFDVTSSSICDSVGNLLFYTNGCKIYNAQDEVIKGGDSLTRMDNYWTQEFFCPYGFTGSQGVLILPCPNNANKYFLFHQDVETDDEFLPYINELYLTTIEKLENNEFKVTTKRELLCHASQTLGSLSAVKQSNGRDWWIAIPLLNGGGIKVFKLTEEGIVQQSEQKLGSDLIYDRISMSAKFSPDGKTYARYHLLEGVELFDFDRLTGQFSNLRHLPFWEELVQGQQLGDGLEFSPDSKRMYVDYNTKLFQFDMAADDVFGSLQLIDTLRMDSTEILRPSFYQMQLAPDGKIYMAHLNSTKVLHVIHDPNALGKACNFEQRAFALKTWNAFTMPYFPNFRLGPDSTVQTTTPSVVEKIYLYPNPAQTVVYLSGLAKYEGQQLDIYNVHGALCRRVILESNKVDISTLAPGVYFLHYAHAVERLVKVE